MGSEILCAGAMPEALLSEFAADLADALGERDEQVLGDCIMHLENSLRDYKTVESADGLIQVLERVMEECAENQKIIKRVLKLLSSVFEKAKISVGCYHGFFDRLFSFVLCPKSERTLYYAICCFISILSYDDESDENFNYVSSVLNPTNIIENENFLQLKAYYLLLFECYCLNQLDDEKGKIMMNIVKLCLENITDEENEVVEIIIHLLSNFRINTKNSIHIIYESSILPYLEGLNFYLSEQSIITILTIYGEVIQQETDAYPIFNLKKLLKYGENPKILSTVIWYILVYIEEYDTIQQFYSEPDFTTLLFNCINHGSSNIKINSFIIYSKLIQQSSHIQISSLLNTTVTSLLFETIEFIDDFTIKSILLHGLISIYEYYNYHNDSSFWNSIDQNHLIDYLTTNSLEDSSLFSSTCSLFLNLLTNHSIRT